ncbi:hypothetical protein GCM10010199_47320 [Dactylosporangium roseum]
MRGEGHRGPAGVGSIRKARPDGAPVYVILDNLSVHKGKAIRAWVARNRVELCFTPTYSSWANPIEAHFGRLRIFVVAGSNHPNHPVATQALHDYLRWRNSNARYPDILAAQRRERAGSAPNDNAGGAKPPPRRRADQPGHRFRSQP